MVNKEVLLAVQAGTVDQPYHDSTARQQADYGGDMADYGGDMADYGGVLAAGDVRYGEAVLVVSIYITCCRWQQQQLYTLLLLDLQ